MLSTCRALIKQFKAIPNLVCLMLVNIAKFIIIYIETFPQSLEMQAQWTRFLEGSKVLCLNATCELKCNYVSPNKIA
eukprot:c7026_g1_i1 orf=98-328(+)